MKKNFIWNILLIFIFFSGCGIEQSITLIKDPIANQTSDISDTFSFFTPDFSASTLDRVSVKGYELYYKLYNDNGSIPSDQDIENVSLLTSRFNRASQSSDSDQPIKPLIFIPSDYVDQILKITIDFSDRNAVVVTGVLAANPSGGVVITPVNILRSVKDSDGNLKSFLIFDPTTDSDFFTLKPELSIFIALYVFSYGIAYDLTERYSYPVTLGYIQIN